VNFVWGFGGTSPELKQNYSVRWTGVISPTETNDYLLGFIGQDGDWTPHRPSTTTTKAIHLEKGHTYALEKGTED
jgi:hypothetical protein